MQMSNNVLRNNQNITDQQDLTRLLEDLKASTNPLAKALRKKLQGNEVDLQAARIEAVEAIDSLIAEISPTSRSQGPEVYSPGDLADGFLQRIEARKAATTTGFADLNRALEGGFEPDTLCVVLGAPGSGKTTLINHIANHIANSEQPVLYVTSEDTPHNLLAKTVARLGSIPYGAVRRGYQDWKDKIQKTLDEQKTMQSARFLHYVDATQGITLDQIYEQALFHFSQLKEASKGTPVLVVDYLQRISRCENLGVDARQSTTIFVERLRAMGCELHCTVILLCAMNRASGYTAGNSTISSAKESGDIEYTADVIMALGPQGDMDEVSPGVRRWILRIDKNRQGDTTHEGKHIELDWAGGFQRFSPPEEKEQENKPTYTDQQFAAITGKSVRLNGRRSAR